MPLDLILRRALIAGRRAGPMDIGIGGGRILAIEPEAEHFLVAIENGQILRTSDFVSFATIYNGAVKASDVAVRRE